MSEENTLERHIDYTSRPVTLSFDAWTFLDGLCRERGTTRAAVLEQLLREEAQRLANQQKSALRKGKEKEKNALRETKKQGNVHASHNVH